MPINFVGQATVLKANLFNPSIVTQLWLVHKGVVDEADFGAGCVFAPDFVQVVTAAWSFYAQGVGVQIGPTDPKSDDQLRSATTALGKIVSGLPETPYTEMGVSFGIELREDRVVEKARRMFMAPGSPLEELFSTPDSRYGGYVSKDVHGVRLKLAVSPKSDVDTGNEYLLLDFGFHKAFTNPGAADEVLRLLTVVPEEKILAEEIAKRLAL